MNIKDIKVGKVYPYVILSEGCYPDTGRTRISKVLKTVCRSEDEDYSNYFSHWKPEELYPDVKSAKEAIRKDFNKFIKNEKRELTSRIREFKRLYKNAMKEVEE